MLLLYKVGLLDSLDKSVFGSETAVETPIVGTCPYMVVSIQSSTLSKATSHP